MNLIPTEYHSLFDQAFADLEDTFGRNIKLIKETKTPKLLSGDDEDFDFTQPTIIRQDEFDYSYTEIEIKARIKYLDKQDKEFAMITTLGGEQINLVQEFGVLRIKVSKDYCQNVQDSTSIIVDGSKCKIIFRDRPHGIISTTFCTFYLQRVP